MRRRLTGKEPYWFIRDCDGKLCVQPPSRQRKKGRVRRRTSENYLYPWVKATKRRTGYHDLRVKRRDGPVCETCNRKHFPFQGCWSGPLDKRQDRKTERTVRADVQRGIDEKQAILAKVNARGPEWVGPPPQREGGRLIRGPG